GAGGTGIASGSAGNVLLGVTSSGTIRGNVGIGTTTPYGKLAIHAVSGETNSLLFHIASSTAAFATSTLFSVDNTGLTAIQNLLATASTTLQNFTGVNATTSK